MPRSRLRRLPEERQREELAAGAALAALTQHPSWPELERSVARKRTSYERTLLALAKSDAGFNQRAGDYYRGFIDGMEWLVKQPGGAELELERYLKERGVTTEGVA